MITIESLREFKLGGYAVFDFVVSFLGIYLLAPLLTKLFLKLRLRIPKQNWLYLTLPISILSHLLIGEMTPMTKGFIDLKGHFILKIVIVGLTVLGMRGVKLVKR